MRERALRNEICLTMCGSAFKNKGVQAMLDAVIEFMPSPIEMPPTKGKLDRRHGSRRASPEDEEPFAALAFKILNDPFVGNLTFFRVYSGTLNSGDARLQSDQGQARSASAACCRCMPPSAPRSRKCARAISLRRWVSKT